MAIVLALIIALIVYMIQLWYFKKHWNKGLYAELRFEQKGVYPGSECILTETITNNKNLPLAGLQVKFQTDASFRFKDEKNAVTTDKYYRKDLFAPGRKQRIIRKLSFIPSARGYYEIKDIDLITGDLFYIHRFSERIKNHTSLLVFPGREDISFFDIKYRHIMGELVAKRKIEEDPFAFRGIREYRPSDPMNRINHKATARQGELLVNMHETTTSQRVCVIYDGHTREVVDKKSVQEKGLRMAATLCARFLRDGVPTAFLSNAPDVLSAAPVSTDFGSHGRHMDTLNSAMARINLSEDMVSLESLVEEYVPGCGDNVLYIIISGYNRDDIKKATSFIKNRGDECYYIYYGEHAA